MKAIAAQAKACDSSAMRVLLLAAAGLSLGGCVIGTVASTALDVVTLPVKVVKTGVNAVSAGVDSVTTSQSEADQKSGRDMRKADEQRGLELRAMAERCRRKQPLPTDDCREAAPR